jgi:4-hydroxybutyrate dehydrogenase
MPSIFSFPTTILFGAGVRSELRGWLGRLASSRPLVVTDADLTRTNAFALLVESLEGLTKTIFADVRPNPIEHDVESAYQAFRTNDCDAVIAFGGGSAIDVGKAVRLRIKRPEKTLVQFDSDADWTGLVPFIPIPTTAGTGSEVGRSSVIIMGDRKRVIFHSALLANLVVLDPEFTRELPPKLTAATGADALTHCIESFTSPVFHPLCDGIALEGLHLIAGALPRVVRDGGDLEARGLMQVAAAMGGIAFQKDLGATHSLAHPLSALCRLHHGLANALCLPFVMEFNAARKPALYRRVGIALGLDDPSDADTIEATRELLAEIGLKPGLRAHGVDESKLEALADQAFEDSCHATNPVPVTREDLRHLYQRAL